MNDTPRCCNFNEILPSKILKAQKNLKGVFMKTTFRTIVFGSLVAGALMFSAGPVMARDYWHRSDYDYRWSRRADLRHDYRDLWEARRQLDYDATHHKSRKRLAHDQGRIDSILNDIRNDRREFYRGW